MPLIAQLDCNDTFITTGTAQQIGDCIQLTSNTTGQQGCAWLSNPVDFTVSFTHTMTANFGNIDAGGADGICLIYQANNTATCGISGGGIGAEGIPNSFVVEFDTYDNGPIANDIPNDHCAISVNGDIDNPISGPFDLGNIEDGNDHIITFDWEPTTMTYTITFDGNLVTMGMYDIINNCFGGNPNPFWGYSASTGGSFNTQTICPTLPPPIIVDAGIDLSIPCAGYSVILDGTGSDIEAGYIFEWTTSNGNIVSGANTLTPTVNAPGAYTLTLTNTNGNCTETDEVNVTINPFMVNIDPPGLLPCDGSSLFINGNASVAGPLVSYQWSTNDGLILSGQFSQTAEILFPGTYTFTVLYDDGFGNQCIEETSIEVFPEIPPIAQAIDGFITCDPGFTILSGFGSTIGPNISYLWSTVDGIILSDETTLFPTIGAPGQYTLIVIDNATTCTDEITINVTGDLTPPFAVASPTGTLSCSNTTIVIDGSMSSQGNNITYEWTTLDGLIFQGANTDSPVVGAAGIYTLIVRNTDNGCIEIIDVDVATSIDLPDVFILPANDINCTNPTIQLDGTPSSQGPAFTFTWSTPDGNIVANENTLEPSVDAPGTYTLIILNDDNGCVDSTAIVITEDTESPMVEAGSPQIIECEDDFISLNGMTSGNADIDIQWTTNNGNILTDDTILDINVDAGGTYYLEAVNLVNGCTAIDSVFIALDNDIPIVSLVADDSLNCTTTQILIDGNASTQGNDITFIWSTSDGNFISDINSLQVTIDAAGTYNLAITNNTNGCVNDLDIEIFEDILAPSLDIAIPDTLTCNQTEIVIDASNSSQIGNIFTYSWDSTDGNITNGNNTLMPNVNQAGTYTLTITNEQNNCISQADITVEQDTISPSISILPPSTLNCDQSQITIDGTNSSSGIFFDYSWTTADGNIIAGQTTSTPDVDQAGNYQLQITNTDNGCIQMASVEVAIDTLAPTVDAGPDFTLNCYHPEAPLDGTNTDSGNNFNSTWTFQDGSTTATNDLTPTIDIAGIYTLEITNMDNGCTNVDEVIVSENFDTPLSAILMPANLTCTDSLITLDGTSSSTGTDISFEWSTPNGNVFSGITSNLAQASQAGQYFLSVQNDISGCIAIDSTVVIQDENIPMANIQAVENLNCNVQSLNLQGSASSASGNFVFEWQTNDGNITAGTTTLNPTINQAGTYVIQVTDLDNNCQAIASIEVPIDTLLPFVDAGPNLVLNCNQPTLILDGSASDQGNNFSYQWTSSNGNILNNAMTDSPEIDAAGQYTLTIANTTNGCINSAAVDITEDFSAPPLSIDLPDSLYCTITELSLSANTSMVGGLFDFQWTSSNGNFVSGQNTANPIVNSPGTYVLTLTTLGNGCSTIDSTTVFEDITAPTIDLQAPETLTCGNTVISIPNVGMDSESNFSIQWTTNDGNILSGQNTLNPSIDQPGIYTIEILNNTNGCSSMETIEVTQDIIPPTIAILPASELNCNVMQVNLNASSSSSGPEFNYSWTSENGDFVSGQTTNNPIVDAPGTYKLTILNTNNECSATASTTVQQDISLPNIDVQPPAILTCNLPQQMLDATNSDTDFQFQFAWSSSNGSILSGEDTPTPIIDSPGQYFLVINNLLNGCNSGTLVNVSEDIAIPNINIAAPAELNCAILQTTLDATGSSTGSEFSYSWNSLDGSFVSDTMSLNASIDAPGTYTLTIADVSNGCDTTFSVSVEQDIEVPIIHIAIPPILNCNTTIASLNATTSSSGTNFQTNWSNTNSNAINNADSLVASVDLPGVYTLSIFNTDNQCSNTSDIEVLQDISIPVIDIATPDILTCSLIQQLLDAGNSSSGINFEYTWTSTAAIIDGENTTTPLIDQPGTYTLNILNTENFCENTQDVIVDQDIATPSLMIAAPEQLNCAVLETTLNTNGSSTGGAFVYNWTTNTTGNLLSAAEDENAIVDAPGIYTLQITNTINSCDTTASIEVTQDVLVPTVEIGMPDILNCNVTSIALDAANSSSGADFDIQWISVEGNPIDLTDELLPMVTEPGTYILTILNTQNQCEDQVQVVVNQDIEIPSIDIEMPEILSCNILDQILDATGSSQGTTLEYLWTTTDGNILDGNDQLEALIDQAGMYTLLISNTENGCENQETIAVTQDIVTPTLDIAIPDTLNCIVLQFNIDASNSSSGSNFEYEWTSSNGNILGGSDTSTPLINAPGLYHILLSNTQNGCDTTAIVEIFQDIEPPIAVVETPDILSCILDNVTIDASNSSAGDVFAYTWTTLDGNIISGSDGLSPNVNLPGTYTLQVANTDNFCLDEIMIEVLQDIETPIADAGEDFILPCFEDSSPLDGSESSLGFAFEYAWQTVNGSIVEGANTIAPEISTQGTYILVVTNTQNGCIATDEIVISETIPTADISFIPPLCFDDPASISIDTVQDGIMPFVYSIDGGNSFTPQASFTNLDAGEYSVVVQDINGCEYEELVIIEQVDEVVIATLRPEESIRLGDSIQIVTETNILEEDISQIQWFGPEGTLSCDTCLSPIVTPLVTTDYTVVITSVNGCTNETMVRIFVDRSRDVYIPNAFSPNNDGSNDRFIVFARAASIKEIRSFQVFSRWGEVMFESYNFPPNEFDFGWDGNFRGQPLNTDVFAYFVEVEFIDGRVEVYKGDLTLLR